MKPTILAFSPGLWRWPETFGSPRYHLWTLARRGWPVIYTEPPTRWNWKRRIWKAPDRPFTVISPSLVPLFALSRVPAGAPADAWRSVACRQLARNAMSLDEAKKAEIHWYGAPWMGSIMRHLPKPRIRVQHVNDELVDSPIYTDRQKDILKRWESELQQECDVVLCSSSPQAEARKGKADRVELLENAVRDDFLEVPPPRPQTVEFEQAFARLQCLPRPRVVYGGVVDLRLNPENLRAVMNWEKLGSFCLFGKIDPRLDRSFLEELQGHPKVHLFDTTPYDWYPTVYTEADVLIIPHHIIPFTKAMYSAKFNEYLSSGKPIVSVKLPEVIRVSAESDSEGVVLTAASPEEFAAACDRALDLGTSELARERRRLAARRTWSVQGEKLEQILLETMDD